MECHGGKKYENGMQKLAKVFRVSSSISYAVVKTYRHFGHMAPVPSTVATWAKNLHHVLTDQFLLKNVVFKRKTLGDQFTCTNIPVLLSLVCYLHRFDVIKLGHIAKSAEDNHMAKGSYKYAHKNRQFKIDFPLECDQTWVNEMPFWIEASGELFEFQDFIKYLWYGREGVAEDAALDELRSDVNKATASITINILENFYGKGELSFLDIPGKAVVGAASKDKEGDKKKNLNPFLEKRAVLNVCEAKKEDRVDMLDDMRKDCLAKALNITLHMKMMKATDGDLKETGVVVALEEGMKPPKHQDLGRLIYLVRPVGTPNVPNAIGQVSSMERWLENIVAKDTTFDYNAPATEIWDKLQLKNSWKKPKAIIQDKNNIDQTDVMVAPVPRKSEQPTPGVPTTARGVKMDDPIAKEDDDDDGDGGFLGEQPTPGVRTTARGGIKASERMDDSSTSKSKEDDDEEDDDSDESFLGVTLATRKKQIAEKVRRSKSKKVSEKRVQSDKDQLEKTQDGADASKKPAAVGQKKAAAKRKESSSTSKPPPAGKKRPRIVTNKFSTGG
jgi:hypothetical protein